MPYLGGNLGGVLHIGVSARRVLGVSAPGIR